MPRYFFNVHDGKSFSDDVGAELPDIMAAREMAVRLSGALLIDHSSDFWNGHDWKMDVVDENGLILFALLFVAIDAPVSQGWRTSATRGDA